MRGGNARTVWILVPARGGSKGIPRKNLRLLAGKPLILYTLTKLYGTFGDKHVIVSTDNNEIANLCSDYAVIHHRSAKLATDQATLDDVAVEVAHWLIEHNAQPDDFFITVQPTSPFLKVETLMEGIDLLEQGAKSVLSVTDDRHLRWTMDVKNNARPLFSKRVNRQWLPPTYAETGGVIGARIKDVIAAKSRIMEPVALLLVSREEGLDIDTYADWAVAEYYLRRKRIMIRADASSVLGMGHVYRAIALAHELSEHKIKLVTRTDKAYQLGADFLARYPYFIETIKQEDEFFDKLAAFKPDIVILDILDTEAEFIRRIRDYAQKIVSLEDLGPGARMSDIVINDLYTDFYPQKNHWYGVEYAILNPQFETVTPKRSLSVDVQNIIVAFGGTDPQNLTIKALSALKQIEYQGKVNVVLGPGYPHSHFSLKEFALAGDVLHSVEHIANIMRESDLAITSAGRTVTELMTLGVPTIVMCQNIKELRHTHASSPFGVINLGLGKHINVSVLAQHLSMLLSDFSLRQNMHIRALNATRKRSNKRVAQRILQAVELEEDVT